MNSNLVQAIDLYNTGVEGEGGLNRDMRCGYLLRSIEIFNRELSKARAADRPSILKNIGMSHFRAAQLMDPPTQLNLILFHLGEALNSISTAWLWRPRQMREGAWGMRVEEIISDCFQRAFQALEQENDDEEEGLPKYFLLHERLIKKIGEDAELDCFRADFSLAKGHHFWGRGVKAMEGGYFKKSMQLLEYSQEEVNNLMSFCCDHVGEERTPIIMIDIECLQEDIAFLRLSCESVRYRCQGDNLFDLHINQSEELDFEMAWEILDLYKAAGLSCREVDVENEAIAISRQGRMFDKIFKIRDKAHEYYRRAFDLAQTMFPRDMGRAGWYIECQEALKRFQLEVLRAEEAKREKEKEPYLKKMTDVLAGLKEVHLLCDGYKLLKYVYSKHPPKVKFEYDEKLVTMQTIKKCLMTAITQYHPDKQMEYDMEWRILCEEITKSLTARYEAFK